MKSIMIIFAALVTLAIIFGVAVFIGNIIYKLLKGLFNEIRNS